MDCTLSKKTKADKLEIASLITIPRNCEAIGFSFQSKLYRRTKTEIGEERIQSNKIKFKSHARNSWMTSPSDEIQLKRRICD